jgi:hypothetical protein
VVREFQTPDTRKPKEGEGDTWKEKRLPIEVHESSEEKFHLGIWDFRDWKTEVI